ncbi:MAG: CAP domain-containing protein [Candidatus Spechtbacteria bacterium]|nr:CAP domain-containing protein [Candidatus Spechtbacteria bacterium]
MKKYQTILWIIIFMSAGGLFLWQQFAPASDPLTALKEKAEEIFTENLREAILTPEPLRGPLDAVPSTLTRAGIIEWTNIHRSEELLPLLAENQKLNASAALKAQDILEKQYFAHESPTGEGVSDLAEAVGYEYILLGENLALGNFKTDKDLVQAWMDSPGHRENILHESYTQIGVGLSRGKFEGKEVWVAVQHFGKPRSACPSPSESTLEQINANKNELESLVQEIEAKKQEIENTEPKRGPLYSAKVREYNDLVEEYNNLAEETKLLVESYNAEVQEFNKCAES